MDRRMMRAWPLAGALLLTGAAAVAAQEPDIDIDLGDVGQGVLVGVRNDVTLEAGQTADAVVVIQADAVIEGTTRGLVMIDANVTIEGPGASVDDVFAVGGSLTVGSGATVDELGYIDTQLTLAPGTVASERDLERDLSGAVGWVVAGAAIFLFIVWIGLGISTLVSGLLMVAFGTSQARRAAWLIGNHPIKVLVAGFLALILPWIVFALLAVTVVGLPLAFGLGLVWVLAVFLGYLVAGLWIGERVLRSSRDAARPYAAVFVGVLILLLLSWFPLVTFIATWFGLGAVTMAAWRVLRGGGRPAATPMYGQPYAQPYGYGQPVPPPAYAPPPYAPPYAPPGQAPEQWPPQDRWPPQQPPASWPG